MTEPWISRIGAQPEDFRSQDFYFSRPGQSEESEDIPAEDRTVVHYGYGGNS